MFEGQQVSEAVIVNEAVIVANAHTLENAVREHARLVYRISFSVLRKHHDAEDSTQEVFIRVLRYRHKLPEVEDIRTWLAALLGAWQWNEAGSPERMLGKAWMRARRMCARRNPELMTFC